MYKIRPFIYTLSGRIYLKKTFYLKGVKAKIANQFLPGLVQESNFNALLVRFNTNQSSFPPISTQLEKYGFPQNTRVDEIHLNNFNYLPVEMWVNSVFIMLINSDNPQILRGMRLELYFSGEFY